MALILICVYITRIYAFDEHNNCARELLVLFVLTFKWFITKLAENDRSPARFSEGESEFVSGFDNEIFFSIELWYILQNCIDLIHAERDDNTLLVAVISFHIFSQTSSHDSYCQSYYDTL